MARPPSDIPRPIVPTSTDQLTQLTKERPDGK